MRSIEYEHVDGQPPEFTPSGGCLYEYDDGNGLWINAGETPIYQAFIRKYYPQD